MITTRSLTVALTAVLLMAFLAPVRLMQAAPPPAPTDLAPADNTVLTTFNPTLRWTLPADATQYHLQVLPANHDGPAIDIVRNAEPSYSIPAPPAWYGLLPDMTYTWKVRASNAPTAVSLTDPSWGPWSQDMHFRTPAVSAASITLISPVGDITAPGLTPQLRWSDRDPNVWYYEVQLSRDPTFETHPARATAPVYWELRHGGVTDPPRSYDLPPGLLLEEDRVYYWRVRPRVQGDGRPLAWSPAAQFRTGSASAIARLTSTIETPIQVVATTGAIMAVPPRAVPLTPAGTPGTIAFTIERNNVIVPALPDAAAAAGWRLWGLSYVLGPVGFTFDRPVTVSLPVPPGTEPGQAAVYRYNLATGAWAALGGDVDVAAARVVVTVYELSAVAVAVLPSGSWAAQRSAAPGKVVLQHVGAPGSSAWLSLCVDGAASTLRTPDAAPGWLPTGLSALAAPPATAGWPSEAGMRLPLGRHRLFITRHTEQGAAWMPWPGGEVEVDSGESFRAAAIDPAQGTWTVGRAPCAGPALAAVGTGDVQVTLSWAAPIDLDLGVTEPNGDQVWFGNTPAASGARLDRDTHCGNFQLGRPENVVWPAGGATPHGRYRVSVTYYRECVAGAGAAAYAVRALSGDRARTVFGRVDRVGDERTWFTFTYP